MSAAASGTAAGGDMRIITLGFFVAVAAAPKCGLPMSQSPPITFAGDRMAHCIVGSPPFSECDNFRGESKKAFEDKRQAARGRRTDGAGHIGSFSDYGTTPGQLGAMREGNGGGIMAEVLTEIEADEWAGCYDDGWKGLIVDAAFAHPAKVARGLIRRIYDHAFAHGWIAPGMTVVDPFGGVGGCGYEAVHARRQALSAANWNRSSSRSPLRTWPSGSGYTAIGPNWVEPVILQGDSRRLCESGGDRGGDRE